MMRFLKKSADFYVDASIHVAAAVYAMVWITLLSFDIAYDKAVGYVVFCATVVSYNFMKYGTTARKYIIVSSVYLRIIQGFSFVCFGIAARYVFLLRFEALLVLALTTALAGLYALPFLPGRRNFRSLHGVKIYMVALSWSLLTVLFPLVNSEIPLSGAIAVAFVRRFLIVLVLTLPFDIRDLKYDALSLGTIPQKIGEKRTKRLGMLLLLLFYFLLFLRPGYTVEMLVVDGIVVLVTGLLVFFAKKDQSVYYSSVYVESIPGIWLLLLLLAERLF